MGTRALEQIFTPSSIAVIGASDKSGSLGGAVLRNLLEGKFEGDIYPVNARGYKQVSGLKACARISQLPAGVELAIICTPADTVDKIITSLAKANIPAAVIMTGGTARVRSGLFTPSRSRLLAVQEQTKVRILGPDCLGVINPNHKLNASNLHIPVKPGHIAYLGQSGAIANAITDWAIARNIGFSHILTLGQGQDIKLADAVDYLASDKTAKTLLVHLDDFKEGRILLRSLRAASRNKLVLVVKSNRFPASPLSNNIHTPGILNRDALIDHALQRAGVLRVGATDEMFDCIDTIQQKKQLKGDRLAIISNSRGGAILAIDRLLHDKGTLADFSSETQLQLSTILPEYTSASNPVLLNPELKAEQLKAVAALLLKDNNIDAVLVVYIPGLGTEPEENALALTQLLSQTNKTLFCSWMGEHSVQGARALFDRHSVPNFETPDNAIKAFMYMVSHTRTQELMRETPESIETLAGYSDLIAQQLPINDVINPQLAWQLLKSYGFASVDNYFTQDAKQLAKMSEEVPPPWVVKIHHKEYLKPFAYGENARQRWRSVGLNITSKGHLKQEVVRLNGELKDRFPDSPVMGYSIQTMHRALDNLQISLGLGRDEEVGPFIFFGGGGSTADILTDRQVAIPPLNTVLARHLIERSHASQVMRERSDNYAQELIILSRWLVAISQLSSQYPSISGLELNAIRANNGEFLVLGVAGQTASSITPTFKAYPVELEQTIRNHKNRIFKIRPIKAEDEGYLADFYHKLSPDTLRFRFFNSRQNFEHKELARFSQIDYDREMEFVAFDSKIIAGVVRSWIDPDSITAEFSVLVGDDQVGQQLGFILMQKMIDYLAHRRGVLQLVGSVLVNNHPMLKLARRLGFSEKENQKEGFVEIVLNLNPATQSWQTKRLYILD
ncbi:Acyl-CoA synthetase (NDP forming) [Oleispira antarctica RB-8]|uniref:Acyl-CoA synthetase (NDP forming) n=1 Tax=Oleispira antarctica RB-8 TaxID=698738 RepID=R4YTT5_OLEAN|nr:Acyl-CoA synthetase (NDP forming) [Oleispira antarctica RB-8]